MEDNRVFRDIFYSVWRYFGILQSYRTDGFSDRQHAVCALDTVVYAMAAQTGFQALCSSVGKSEQLAPRNDELPTIYFRGLDNLIATARSNKVAVCLGFQDFSQLKRDYGDKEAAVVMNTVPLAISFPVKSLANRQKTCRNGSEKWCKNANP